MDVPGNGRIATARHENHLSVGRSLISSRRAPDAPTLVIRTHATSIISPAIIIIASLAPSSEPAERAAVVTLKGGLGV
jgi:hypothetical protein